MDGTRPACPRLGEAGWAAREGIFPVIHRFIKQTTQAGIVSSSLAEGGQATPGKVHRVIETTTLGRGGPVVSRVGLGLMSMSGIYGQADDAESIATIRAAVDAGVNLLDTGDFYGMGHNELLLRDALRHIPRDSVFIQVKFGGQRDPSGAFVGHDATPNAVKNSLAYSLTRLGTEYIDLYQPARLDPRVPIEDTVGAIVEMVQAGYVRYIGLSEVGADNIRRAHAVHPIAAVQLEYSLMSRGIEAKILPAVRELGISVTAYGILSRGLLSSATAQLAPDDPRTRFPRFRDENHARNLELLVALEALAAEHAVTAAQLAIAWVASRGKDIIPLIGTKRRERLAEALKALDLTLSGDDLAAVEGAVPADAVAGGRYEASQMAVLDSER
jgi:aryl-alcohol dehydrogenase-like predicted oxidoreductase